MSDFSLSRRHLLFAAGLAPAALLAPKVALAAPESSRPTLVCVLLRGGLDGLSAVIPHAEPALYTERRQIAVPPPGKGDGAALKLDDRFALHPSLAPLLPAWNAGELAIVHAVGSPHPTRSHFEAQDHLEWGALERQDAGWLARAATARGAPRAELSTVSLTRTTPLALRGQAGVLAAPRLDQVGLKGPPKVRDRLESAFARLYQASSGSLGRGGSAHGVARGGTEALKLARRVRALAARDSGERYHSAARGLADVAALIRASVGLEIAWIDAGGWDTHTGQAGRLKRNLNLLARSMAAFREDLGPHLERTLVLVMTEFGRTVSENGTGGTDHGHGSVMFALGGGVRGRRVLGRWPGLAPEQRYDGRDLAVTTDFRDVLSEVLAKHLGVADPSAVLLGHRPAQSVGLFG